MKTLIALLLSVVSAASMAGGNDIVFTKRNAADTAQGPVTPPHPTTGPGLMFYDHSTLLPGYLLIGSGLSVTSGVLDVASSSSVTWSTLTGKPTWTGVFDGGYSSLTGLPTLFDGTWNSLNGKPTTFTPAAHNQAWTTITSTPTTLAGYGIVDAYPLSGNPSNFVTSASLSSTLSGYATTSALSTGLSGKFDTPSGTTAQYIRGDGSLATMPSPGVGTVTSVGISSSTLSIGGSPITSSGTMTVNLPLTGTAGTYSGVMTDAQGRVTAGTSRSFNYTTRSLNTCFQVSSTRDALVTYSVDIQTSLSLTTGQQGTVYLRTYSNSGCSSGAQEVTRFVNGQTGTLTIGLALTQNVTGTLTGVIPAGSYVQLVTENNVGTPTFTARPGQETLL